MVVRCADWAGPVRDRAREVLAEVLDAGTAVSLAPMILRVGDRHRGNHALGLLDDVLRRAPRERLAPLLVSSDRRVRRFAYRMAVEEGTLSPVELARAAAEDDDAVVQGRCAQAALGEGPRAEALDILLGARNPQARSAGVTALRRLGQAERAVDFLADPSALVRACARYVVRQHGIDPLPWYRARCADPDLPPGAAIGLAECGDRADAPLLWALLEHPAPGVRARAVAGLRTLDMADVRRLRPLLDDPAPGVVGEATLALLPSARDLPEEWLLRRLAPGRPRWERVSAWRLLDAHGDAARLRAAVPLLDDADVRLRTWAEHAVRLVRRREPRAWRSPEIVALLDRAGAVDR
ncbi:HEAT repeat domain-containing protein [Streptomyces sp. DT195]|uniref:HEAT repeat domain-containing protein n=1 Tax=Streptomyces sp. DT195 TaxID=3393419 RepID=UPI003CF3D2A2